MRRDGKGEFVEAAWPEADFIIGNPPFLGGKLMRRGLGDETVETLFKVYDGRVPAEADLVCYWFAKAWQALRAKRTKRVGLVATNSIRGGANRKVLEPIAEAGAIFEAWSDEPWMVDGAAVRVSLGLLRRVGEVARLDGCGRISHSFRFVRRGIELRESGSAKREQWPSPSWGIPKGAPSKYRERSRGIG